MSDKIEMTPAEAQAAAEAYHAELSSRPGHIGAAGRIQAAVSHVFAVACAAEGHRATSAKDLARALPLVWANMFTSAAKSLGGDDPAELLGWLVEQTAVYARQGLASDLAGETPGPQLALDARPRS